MMWKWILSSLIFTPFLHAAESKANSKDWSAWVGASVDGRQQDFKLQSSYSPKVNLGFSTSLLHWDFKHTDKFQIRTFAFNFVYFFIEGLSAQLAFGTMFGDGEVRFLQQYQVPVDDGPSFTAYRWANADWGVQRDFSALRFAYRVNFSDNWMGEISSGEYMILTGNSGIRVYGHPDGSDSDQVRLKSYLQRQFRKDLYFQPQLTAS